MKKFFLILMAIAMTFVCTAALAEEEPDSEPAPDPDNYSGIWQCDRASIQIDWEEVGYRILVQWASSAWEVTEWEYSCYYHEDDNTVVSMPFGMRTDLVYSDGDSLPAYTIIYEDGEAIFSIDEEGFLIWNDLKENAGEGLRFERISDTAYPEAEEEANG